MSFFSSILCCFGSCFGIEPGQRNSTVPVPLPANKRNYQSDQKPGILHLGKRSSNSQKEKKKSEQRSSNLSKSQIPFRGFGGLPNLGNTCYLNTALQLLFSMQQMRTVILDNYQRFPQKKCIRLIGAVFQSILKNQQYREKVSRLKELVGYLQEKSLLKNIRQQHDLIKMLTSLLDLLRAESRKIKKYVVLTARKKCGCDLEIQYDESFIRMDQQCGGCGGKIRLQPIGYLPSYLLVVENGKVAEKEIITLFNVKRQKVTYELISFGSYVGDTEFGHYTCCLKNGENWVQISDYLIQQIGKDNLRAYVSRVSVYKLIEKEKDCKGELSLIDL